MAGVPLPGTFEIVGLVVSPVSRYDGRPADGPSPSPGEEYPTWAQVRAHRGLVGDRYFGSRYGYAVLTFIAIESIERLEQQLAAGPFDPRLSRRNVITRGLDVDALARTTFAIALGDDPPLRFRSLTPANPCAWMDVVFAPGARRALRGHGGIRCEPLDDGELRFGPARLLDAAPIPPDQLGRRVRAAVG